MEEEKKDKTFVIRDRRLFDESGQPRTETASTADAAPAAEVTNKEKPSPAVQEPSSPDAQADLQPEDAEELPEVSFYNFILSLSSTVMYHFGDFADPATKKAQKNLVAAKQTIDLLSLLQDKTKGNLNQDEKNLLNGILYELRMRYVKETAEG